MRRALGRVVPVHPEVPALLGGVAGDQEALHARDLERKRLLDLRHDAAPEAVLENAGELRVLDVPVADVPVAPDLVAGVLDLDRPAVDVAHEAARAPAMPLVP